MLPGPLAGVYTFDDSLFTVFHDSDSNDTTAGEGRLADLDHDGLMDLFVLERSEKDGTFGYVFWGTAW